VPLGAPCGPPETGHLLSPSIVVSSAGFNLLSLHQKPAAVVSVGRLGKSFFSDDLKENRAVVH
jgi:hypothetical protein